jgi:hypothetical protein
MADIGSVPPWTWTAMDGDDTHAFKPNVRAQLGGEVGGDAVGGRSSVLTGGTCASSANFATSSRNCDASV